MEPIKHKKVPTPSLPSSLPGSFPPSRVERRDGLDQARANAGKNFKRNRRINNMKELALQGVGLISKPLKEIIKTIMAKSKTQPTGQNERIKVPSTAKGFAEVMAGIGLFGMSQDIWMQIVSIGVFAYGLVDIVRKERKED